MSNRRRSRTRARCRRADFLRPRSPTLNRRRSRTRARSRRSDFLIFDSSPAVAKYMGFLGSREFHVLHGVSDECLLWGCLSKLSSSLAAERFGHVHQQPRHFLTHLTLAPPRSSSHRPCSFLTPPRSANATPPPTTADVPALPPARRPGPRIPQHLPPTVQVFLLLQLLPVQVQHTAHGTHSPRNPSGALPCRGV